MTDHNGGASVAEAPCALDGRPMDARWLRLALAATVGSDDGEAGIAVGRIPAGAEIIAVSDLRWETLMDTGQSRSFGLQCAVSMKSDPALPTEKVVLHLHVKRVDAVDYAGKKTPAALRRDMESAVNEFFFYRSVAPLLCRRKGDGGIDGGVCVQGAAGDTPAVPLPTPVHVSARLSSDVREAACLFVLARVDPARFFQTSPLEAEVGRVGAAAAADAGHSLELLARLHAWGWQAAHPERFAHLARDSRLHARGTYWDLRKRGDKEMLGLPDAWGNFLDKFAGCQEAKQLCLDLHGMDTVGARLSTILPRIDQEIHERHGDRWKTLVHGDFKAMNVFLVKEPGNGEGASSAVPIDFQWTGVGWGMLDVAMHVWHSVNATADHADDEALVRFYHKRLGAYLPESVMADYCWETAWRHYRLCLLDYARMVISCFWRGASPDVFKGKADQMNVGMVYRDARSALQFAVRVAEFLGEIANELGAE